MGKLDITEKATLLVVDDTPDNLVLMSNLLKDDYKAEEEARQKGLELGAVDYITKPISPPIVIARVKNHLALKVMADFLRDQNDFLELEVAKRTSEVMAIQDVTILAMASLAETRDSDIPNTRDLRLAPSDVRSARLIRALTKVGHAR